MIMMTVIAIESANIQALGPTQIHGLAHVILTTTLGGKYESISILQMSLQRH